MGDRSTSTVPPRRAGRRRHTSRPRALAIGLLGLVSFLALAAQGVDATFTKSVSASHSSGSGALTGTNGPATGTASFTGAAATTSTCTLAWSALSGGTTVADRYEVLNVGTGAAAATPGTVTAGSSTITQRPLTQRYQLTTRRGTNWVSPTAETKYATCSLGEMSSVSVGQHVSCGIKSTGTLWCWGFGMYDGTTGDANQYTRSSPVQVGAATNWRQVSVGGGVACGTRTDDSGACWGNNWAGAFGDGTTNGSTTPVTVTGSWRRLSAGGAHTCGIKTDSSLYCWGSNGSGQLGLGTTTDQLTPVRVGTDTWTLVATGDSNTCGIKIDQSLWCWGANWNAQVGNNSYTSVTSPVQLGGLWTAVSTSLYTTCGIKTDGTLWCWGNNGWGQGANAALGDLTTPTQVGSGTSWARVGSGRYSGCGIQTDGTLWCWGTNAFGATGAGSTGWTTTTTPTKVGTSTTWLDVNGYELHLCAIRSDAALQCWGSAGVGETGQGGTNWQTFAQVGAVTTWSSLSVGRDHACAIRADATLWCWGRNVNGQLGFTGNEATSTPTQVSAGTGSSTTFSVVAVGGDNTCAIRADGQLYCWGTGQSGQNGNGNSNWIDTPTRVGGTATYSMLSTGATTTCAIKSTDSTLWCWGSNWTGQVGDGTTTDRVSPAQVSGAWSSVAVSSYHSCGIKTDGSLWCWGANWNGNLGDGTANSSSSPVRVGALTGWSQVTVGDYHTCGRRSATAYCWGANGYGQLANGNTAWQYSPVQVSTTASSLSAGSYATCGKDTSNQLWCAGQNATGAWGNGSLSVTNSSWVALTTSVSVTSLSNSGYFQCLIKTNGTLWCAGANEWSQLGTTEATNSPATVTGTWKS